MKILMCTDAMGYGGAETHILSLCARLKKLGHTVAVASPGGELVNSLMEANIPHFSLPQLKKTPLSLMKWRKKLKKIVRRCGFEVLHAHARMPALAAKSVAKKTKAAFVVTAHAKFRMDAPRRLLSVWGTRTIAVSEDIKAHVIKCCRVKPRRVSVIANGVDTDKFCPAESWRGVGHRIIFVSRLDTDCALAARMLCKLAGKLSGIFPDVTITIVGGGSAYGEISVLAELMNIACGRRVIIMKGAQEDVAALLRKSDVFVGVSRAALEAMACGLPVIIAGDEGYGGIFEPRDGADNCNLCARRGNFVSSDMLFDDVCRVLSLPVEQKRRMGDALREYVKKNYSAESSALRTVEVYRAASRKKKT